MERVIVWIDASDEDAETVRRKLEEFLNLLKVSYTVVDASQLKTVEIKQ